MIRKAFVVLAALALAGSAQAFGANGASVSKDKRTTTVQHGSTAYAPIARPPHKLDTIFDNIGFDYPKGLYFCCYGDTISGPNSAVGSTVWPATQFTPAADAKVKEIDVAATYVSGVNKVIINLAEDNGGVPGNVLGSWPATGLGTFGDCCQLATVSVSHIKLTAGTPYWIFLSTDDTNDTTWAVWPFNSTDQVDSMVVAGFDGTSWTNFGAGVPALSFAVLGNDTRN